MRSKSYRLVVGGLLAVGLALGSAPAISAWAQSGAVASSTGVSSPPAGDSAETLTASRPMIWHLVIRIALTKAGCENIRRITPNSWNLKCVRAGSVWVLIPVGRGY